MARRKNQPESVRTKCSLAERLRTIRSELFGERGGPEMARRLNLPIRTWYNYEAGVTVPAEVVLRFMELTAVEPLWLLHGQGAKFRSAHPRADRIGGLETVEDLLRTALERLGRKDNPPAAAAAPPPLPGPDPAVVGDDSPNGAAGAEAPDREWLAARREGRCIRVEGDSMAPIVAHGAEVAFADAEEDLLALDGKLVVAWIEGRPVVRWLQRSGRFALLRPENPGPDASTQLLDLETPARERRIRRVLWIGTRH